VIYSRLHVQRVYLEAYTTTTTTTSKTTMQARSHGSFSQKFLFNREVYI
jgi:hypothetical protein